VISVDADGQHAPADILSILAAARRDPEALIIGQRNMEDPCVPLRSKKGRDASRFWLRIITGQNIPDTQCGLRRYPIAPVLSLGCKAEGYAFEAEVLLRAVAAKMAVREVNVDVYYPPEEERITHFHSVRDPARIVATVLRTMADVHVLRRSPRSVVRVQSVRE